MFEFKVLHALHEEYRCVNQSSWVCRHEFVNNVETTVLTVLRNFVKSGRLELSLVNNRLWKNCYVSEEEKLSWRRDSGNLVTRRTVYNQERSCHRFAVIFYVLSEVHYMLLVDGSCMLRELYYKHPLLVGNQRNVNAAVRDVCSMMHTTPGWLGIIASSKGLVAGALRIFMTNGDILDCCTLEGGVLVPPLITSIHHLETEATFVLLVEKDTIFEKLSRNNFNTNCGDMILVTGKGFPDMNTRFLINRLHSECSLPIYTLVDADPYGIEIMLVYRNGSRAMSHCPDAFACPQLRWIGIHPSEIDIMNIPTIPLNQRDRKKLKELQSREYINVGIRRELQVIEYMQRKAELEGLSCLTLPLLLRNYINNKIKRNIVI